MRLAAEHGAEKVTVEAISAAAGVSVRTFFNYFDTRDDVFVLTGAETGANVRKALLAAPAGLTPLQALHEAMVSELAEAEQQHELWRLHGKVLREAPHLLVRVLGAHMADETELAEAVAERLSGGGRTTADAEAPEAPEAPEVPEAPGAPAASAEERRNALELYPRLLAAVAVTAVRVSVDHWCARQEERAFNEVFREVFGLLAAGLPAPPA